MVLREKVTENRSFKFPTFWGTGDAVKRDELMAKSMLPKVLVTTLSCYKIKLEICFAQETVYKHANSKASRNRKK